MTPEETAAQLLDRFVQGAPRRGGEAREYARGEPAAGILAAPPEVRLAVVRLVLQRAARSRDLRTRAQHGEGIAGLRDELPWAMMGMMMPAVPRLVQALLRTKLPLDDAALAEMFELVSRADEHGILLRFAPHVEQIVIAAEAALADARPSERLRAAMGQTAKHLGAFSLPKSVQLADRLRSLVLGVEPPRRSRPEARRTRVNAVAVSDQAPLTPVDPTRLAAMDALGARLLAQTTAPGAKDQGNSAAPSADEEVRDLEAEDARAFILANLERAADTHHIVLARLRSGDLQGMRFGSELRKAIARLMARDRRFTEQEIIRLIGFSGVHGRPAAVLPGTLAAAIVAQFNTSPLPPTLVGPLEEWESDLRRSLTTASRKAANQLHPLLRKTRGEALDRGEAWMDRLAMGLEVQDAAGTQAWQALLQHCATAKSAKPSERWLAQAGRCITPIGRENFVRIVTSVLEQVGQPGTTQHVIRFNEGRDNTLIGDAHADLLRGLVWSTCVIPDAQLAKPVGDAGEMCFKKIPNVGPRSPKIANACLAALSRMGGTAGAAQISRLRMRVKHSSSRLQVNKALNAAAAKAGVSAEELEEMAVPTFGMTQPGRLVQTIAGCTAELRVVGIGVQVTWSGPDAKTLKSVPAAAKRDAPAELKALKRLAGDMQKLLTPLRDRIERAPLEQRRWPFPAWRERYLDHPLVAGLARRLVWSFTHADRAASAAWHDGVLVDANDRPIDWLNEQTTVELWHPIGRTVEETLGWRRWLEAHQVTQPFKQAHREVYLLTDAERQTETYSNRFAAHVLRQHQLAQLCMARGWRYALQGAFDNGGVIPSIQLPRWGIEANFLVQAPDGAFNDDAHSHTGIALTVSSDQVCFLRGMEPLPVADVPPLVFSEVMRDVDLFVGVCSIGNDPGWQPGAGPVGHDAYWRAYSFGDLSATAQTRRGVLERLVPRLKIADRCTLTDKNLVVRGDLRTYKIHLGSANILMEPNDQYLCIVPGRSAVGNAQQVFLPFEGDQTLAIILSKAFLLAADTKIKDPSIIRQIK